jgi:tyrosine-protein phosphatase SIW14
MARRLLVPVLAALLLVGCKSVAQRVNGVNNFAVVQDPPNTIYRGAQPSEAGIETLRQRGVRTVINLRDDPVSDEQEIVQRAGLRYVQIPTSPWKVEPEKIREFLKEIKTVPRPVFVHCALGRDRTGLEIAVYRIVVQKWSRQDAIAELYAYGYNWAIYPHIAKYIKEFEPAEYQQQ